MGKQQAGQRSGWRVWTEAEARTVVADWKASGESGTAYGARHGFSAKRLSRWAALLSVAPSPAASATKQLLVDECREPVELEQRVLQRCGSEQQFSRVFGCPLDAAPDAILWLVGVVRSACGRGRASVARRVLWNTDLPR